MPLTLHHLLSPVSDIRAQASHALSAFALAGVQSQTNQFHAISSTHVRAFLNVQASRHKTVHSKGLLSAMIQSALAAIAPTHPGEGPFWAINVLATLIVLSDSSLFAHPRALKFFLPSIAQVLVHKRSAVRSLHPQLWKCLVWAFLRLPQISEVSQGVNVEVSLIMERAFLLVRQEFCGEIGVVLTASLIRAEGTTPSCQPDRVALGDPLSKALALVDDMVSSDNISTHTYGIALLTQLLGGIGISQEAKDNNQWDHRDILSGLLFDGTLLHAKWDRITAAIRDMDTFKVANTRHLLEPEIIQHWDTLISIWVKCVKKSSQDAQSGLSVSFHVLYALSFITDVELA
jgi:hypothetical protein